MPFDSEGIFSRLHSWEDDRINDIDIVTDHMDEEDNNFADGLSKCFLKNGTSKMEGNFNAGNFKIMNLAEGTLPNDAVSRSQLDASLQTAKEFMNILVKVGDIKASVISQNHDNWVLCNGQELSRVEYAELFDIIGDKFGDGNGVTTFNVPDYQGKFLRGLGGNSAQDIYTSQEEGLPNILGERSSVAMINGSGSGAISTGNISYQSFSASGSTSGRGWATFSLDASKSNKIYGASEHVTPENQAVYWFIKAKREE
ncbi:MAG: tail fiber protein [Alphaproteobacteria bacterium]|nr:tail fiber protein [Alphaproteobacteria bacterium]